MKTFRITVVERKVIEVAAESAVEAETKAFESDAWNTIVEEFVTELIVTNDPKEIYEAFAEDDS